MAQFENLRTSVIDLLQEMRALSDMYQPINSTLAVMNNDLQIQKKRVDEIVEYLNK